MWFSLLKVCSSFWSLVNTVSNYYLGNTVNHGFYVSAGTEENECEIKEIKVYVAIGFQHAKLILWYARI